MPRFTRGTIKMKKTKMLEFCPKCKSQNIEYGYFEDIGNSIIQYVSCSNCELRWTDQYDFKNWELIK
jgi:C4-type Zn-finger protein